MKKIILSLFVMLSILALGIKTKILKADATVTLTEGASIRLDDPAGLRFQATVSEPIEGAKYGIAFANGVVAKENVKVGIDGVVNAEVDELKEDNTYAVSMVKIPERAYFSSITARAYILIDETYIYSDNIVTRNINEVARKWKENNPNKQSDFITQVLTIAKLNTNGGTIRYKNHEAMVEDFLKDFNTYSSKTVTSATELYDAGNVYGTFFTNTEMYNKWSWTLELFLSLTEQGYGNNQDAKTQYETFLLRNGTSVTSQEYLRQSIQSLMTLSKCTSYNEEAAIDFSLYEVSKQIEGAINGGVEFVNINSLPTPYQNGCKFLGWYDEKDNLVTILTEGIELYAKWKDQLEIDAAYNLTESTLELPTTVTIDGNEVSVTWDTTTFIEKQIGNQILTGTYTDEYNKECPIKIKVNVLPYTFRQNTSTKEYTITKYYGTNESVAVPLTYRGEKITNINSFAFSNCSSLTRIEIFSELTSINANAFSGCSNLVSVIFEKGSKVISIGNYAFRNCSSLTTIKLPLSVTSIGSHVFKNCSSLTSIEIPSSVTSIGSEAFSLCSSLTNVKLPSSLTSIGSSAFSDCSSLTSIEIPSSVTIIGSEAFSLCSSLTNVKLPSILKSIGSSAFSSCSSLTSIEIPSSVTIIGSEAFSLCSSLTNVKLPSSLTSIGSSAFSSCSSLTSIEIPSSVTSIGSEAFSLCSSLTNVKLPSNLISIGNSAFSSCSSLTSIEIPSSVTSIDSDAFSSCNSLLTIINNSDLELLIGSTDCGYVAYYAYKIVNKDGSITYIDDDKYAYIETTDDFLFRYDASNNYELVAYLGTKDTVTLPTDINGNTYEIDEIKGVKNVIIPDTFTSINARAFFNCSSLISIIIPSSVTSIGSSAFKYCSSLTNIVIPSSVTNIDYSAFDECINLTIYCEVESTPSGWNSNWNPSNRPVVWGYKQNN